ncbi:MAG: YkgJ family cysteine cluster protein [Rubrivivax sp.]|nr:YkgJ family cysteine cluster protein [Rubrivivax sp.]
MECRPSCGACCIAPSISSPIPGMPNGKPAGVRCIQLDEQLRCRLFGDARRPAVCRSLQPSPGLCAQSADAALQGLMRLERATAPSPTPR